jgi:hypothetical protein
MENDKKSSMTTNFSWVELVLGVVIRWVLERTLSSAWERVKKRLRENEENQKRKSLLLRLAEADFRLIAKVLELEPEEIKFSVRQAADKYGFFRGFLRSTADIFSYSLLRS